MRTFGAICVAGVKCPFRCPLGGQKTLCVGARGRGILAGMSMSPFAWYVAMLAAGLLLVVAEVFVPGGAAGVVGGLALLAAMADADAGLDGDGVRAARGIAALRALGLERVARGAAMQLLLGSGFGGAR